MGQELVVTCKQVGLGLVRLVGEGRMTREPGAVLGGKLQEGGRRTLQRELWAVLEQRLELCHQPLPPSHAAGSLSPGSRDG